MKKKIDFLYLISLASFIVFASALCSCTAEAILFDEFRKEPQQQEPPDETPKMTITTNAVQMAIFLAGSGTAEIDWGNGKENVTLSANFPGTPITRSYSSETTRTIIISGDNITGVNCNANKITSIVLNEITTLTVLRCSENSLTDLETEQNIALRELYCNKNQLSALNIENNTALEIFNCAENDLTVLNVENNIMLQWLICADNKLSNFNITANNNAIYWLDCQNNLFNTAQLNSLFGALHSEDIAGGKTIAISGNSGAGTANRSIAETKGWKVE